MSRIGVVTGLTSEADCFSELPGAEQPRVLCSGARPERAAAAARQLVEEGCDGLVSFGLAGALEEGLGVGGLVLPDRVIGPGGRTVETDARWRKRLIARLARGGVSPLVRPLLGSEHPVTLPSEKERLGRETRAAVVDMESHAVAHVAFEYNVPFLVLRAVSDTARRTVPYWVMDTIQEDGQVDQVKAAIEAICRPWDIPVLVLLGMESKQALGVLRRVVGLAGGRLGLD